MVVRISVAMITYQGAEFLAAQLDSIVTQLGPSDELVISDDGSTDGTRRILKEYQKRYPLIRLLQGPGRGIKKNMEHVLSHCRGKYIFLADQDDLWRPQKVAHVMEQFAQTGAMLLLHNAAVFEQEPAKPVVDSFFRFRGSRPGVAKNILKNSYIGCCMAFRRPLLGYVLPIPDDLEMHDQWIGVLNDFYYKDSVFCEEVLLDYRRHGTNNSQMTHYGVGKMIRNRVVFVVRFMGRVIARRRRRAAKRKAA